jgi:hypothetical protein
VRSGWYPWTFRCSCCRLELLGLGAGASCLLGYLSLWLWLPQLMLLLLWLNRRCLSERCQDDPALGRVPPTANRSKHQRTQYGPKSV